MKITKCMCCMEELTDEKEKCPHCGFSEEEMPSLPHQLPYRSVLNGTYMVGKAIGEGGFGITYIGWDLNLGIKVAIKEFYPDGFVGRDGSQSHTVRSYQGDSTVFFNKGKDKFLEEARSLGKFMQLEGIVSVKDFFLENNTVYIVMEYLEGQSLKSYAREKGGKIEPDELLKIMKPVLESLIEIHKSGVIHRDISPDNIMICKDGKVKLIDFGAAREASPEGEKTLSVMLKKGYSPEEQYRTHGEQGTWTDVYSLCATIYAMMTGIKPDEPLDRMENETLKPLSQMGVKLKKRQEDVLMKGLEIKASDRVQTVEELYRGLYEEGKENEFVIKRKKKKSTFLAVFAVILLVICMGIGAFYMFVPQKLNTVIWIDAQIGQNIAIEDLMTYLPEEATDPVFYMDDTMAGDLWIQSTPPEGKAYELEVHYKRNGRNYIQKVQITVAVPVISPVIEKVYRQQGDVLSVDESWFITENADYLQVNVANESTQNVVGEVSVVGYLYNDINPVAKTEFIVDYIDISQQRMELQDLLGNSYNFNDEKLNACAEALLESADSYDMDADWNDILNDSVASVNLKYPEVSYDGALLYPMYLKDGQLSYTAQDFYNILAQRDAISQGLENADTIGIANSLLYEGEEVVAVYWAIFYK